MADNRLPLKDETDEYLGEASDKSTYNSSAAERLRGRPAACDPILSNPLSSKGGFSAADAGEL
jgi:hypothetical protein